MAFTERSEPTRSAIVTAARGLLAEKGYDGATIRAVASRAEIDPSMVMRYFGNKEGLFAAAVDVDLKLPDPTDWPSEEVGERLARHFVSRWEGELADNMITLLLRSAATNPAAAEQVRSVFGRQVIEFVRAVAGDGPESEQRAAMLASQATGLALCRYILEIPTLVSISTETLVALVAPVIQHYLLGDLSDSPGATVAVPG